MNPRRTVAGSRLFLIAAALGLPALLVSATGAGCGSVIVEEDADASDGAGGDAKLHLADGGEGDPRDGGRDALPDYVDPGCPDAGPKQTAFTCDPYHQKNGDCPPGQGCFLKVTYPSDPCAQ